MNKNCSKTSVLKQDLPLNWELNLSERESRGQKRPIKREGRKEKSSHTINTALNDTQQ